MKERLKRWSLRIFTIGTALLLIAAVLVALLYVVGFIVGGEQAASIVLFVHTTVFPVMFMLNIVFCVSGIVHVYLIKDKGFRFEITRK